MCSRIVAPAGIGIAAYLRGQPYAALAVHHRIVRIGRVVRRIRPQVFVAPEHRRTVGRRETRRNLVLGFARRNVERVCTVVRLVHNDQGSVSCVDGVVRAATVHVRVILIGRNLIVHEGVVIAHVPQRCHDIALDPRGARGSRRNSARFDGLSPARQRLQRGILAHLSQQRVHIGAAHARAEAPFPSFGVGLEFRLGPRRRAWCRASAPLPS